MLNSLIIDSLEKVYIDKEDNRRPYLGASIAGDDCHRKIWYQYTGQESPGTPSRIKRIFETGHIYEERIQDLLRRAGMIVTDDQKEVSCFDGKFKGHIDGILKNVPGRHGESFLLEIKTHNDKSFNRLKKFGVEREFKKHFVQVQLYMHFLDKINSCMYVAVNKNDDSFYVEELPHSKDFSTGRLSIVSNIIESYGPPERLSDRRDYYLCKLCHYKETCHGD